MRLSSPTTIAAIGLALAGLACGLGLPSTPTLPPPATAEPATPTQPPIVSTIPVPPTESAGPGEINGLVWKDRCLLTGGEGGEPLVLGQGCVSTGPNPWEWGANQVYEPGFEPGLAGVTLHLGLGACPSSGAATALTSSAGTYAFTGLAPGTYCVSFDALTDGNDAVLIPGGLSYPTRGGTPEATVTVAAGGSEVVNFGWTFQFGD